MQYRALLVKQEQSACKASLCQRTALPIAANDVLIEVHYSSINYKDALAVCGRPGVMRHYPMVGGIDAAGVVVESASKLFKAGDSVVVTGYGLSQTHDGGYAEYLCVPAAWVVPLPPGLSLYEAMILGTAGYTAALSIQRLQDNGQQPGMGPLVVTGATGGVGSCAINMLSGIGYEVIALSGKHDKQAYLRKLGAAECLDRTAVHVPDKPLARATWGGAIDSLGGEVLSWLLSTVRPYGNIATCGLALDSDLSTTVMPFILRGVSLLGIASAESAMPLRMKIWHRLAEELKPRDLEDMVTALVPLDEVVHVAESMLAGKTSGRYVVQIK